MKILAIKFLICIAFSLVYVNEASDFEVEFEFEEKLQDKCAVIDGYLPRKTRHEALNSCLIQNKTRPVCVKETKGLTVDKLKKKLKELCKAGKYRP